MDCCITLCLILLLFLVFINIRKDICCKDGTAKRFEFEDSKKSTIRRKDYRNDSTEDEDPSKPWKTASYKNNDIDTRLEILKNAVKNS